MRSYICKSERSCTIKSRKFSFQLFCGQQGELVKLQSVDNFNHLLVSSFVTCRMNVSDWLQMRCQYLFTSHQPALGLRSSHRNSCFIHQHLLYATAHLYNFWQKFAYYYYSIFLTTEFHSVIFQSFYNLSLGFREIIYSFLFKLCLISACMKHFVMLVLIKWCANKFIFCLVFTILPLWR